MSRKKGEDRNIFMDIVVSENAGTQQPWVFLLKISKNDHFGV